jgi:trehalose utilization protein
MANAGPVRVLVWDENPPHAPKEIYPNSINGAVAEGLRELGGDHLQAKTANLDDPDQGINEAALCETDVLIWWGHARHGQVKDEVAELVKKHVHENGLGFVCLHSGHYSKTFRAVLNATGHLKGGWREDGQPEEIRVCAPHHPIAKGVSDFTLDAEEMYGSPFDVPPPVCTVFQSYFPAGGEYFPCGLTWSVGEGVDPKFTSGPGGGKGQGEGRGRVFYFRPGHETLRTYFDPNVRRVITNAVFWAARREV